MIDLHLHSTFSDGSFPPEELVARGCAMGLSAMALTDHDCLDGIAGFMHACRASAEAGYRGGQGLIGIPGVEISADVAQGTLHMLGYHVSPGNAPLDEALKHLRAGRAYRNEQILQRLNEEGLELTWDEVASHAGEDVVGRPHFAMAMLKRGYIADKQEAFDKYLGKGKRAYADRFRLSPQASIEIIRGAGGVPVLAHPFTLGLGRKELRESVAELKAQGLQGIEVYYAEHNAKLVDEYRRLAVDFDLVATGGTDFHGEANPDVNLGVGFGGLKVADSIVDELAARRP